MTKEAIYSLVELIAKVEKKHAVKLRKHLDAMDDMFYVRAGDFLRRYEGALQRQGKTLQFAIDSYIALLHSMLAEQIDFLRTGRYSSSSFAEVNQRVYKDPEVMQQHMHGLALAQFLWPDQYRRFSFFCEQFAKWAPHTRRYLEVGGGHALYLSHAVQSLPPEAEITVVDISPTSIDLARAIAGEERVRYQCMDMREFAHDGFDFITMGEVLEHLEDPLGLLRHVRSMLLPTGRLYATTPANAPMIDHIWLFRDEDEIRTMLRDGGFEIEQECLMFTDGADKEKGRELQLPLMYAALLRPGN